MINTYVYSLPVLDEDIILVHPRQFTAKMNPSNVCVGDVIAKDILCPGFPNQTFETLDGKLYYEIHCTERPKYQAVSQMDVTKYMERKK